MSSVRLVPDRPYIDYEVISTVIPPFPLIQEKQLSDTGECMCTNTG